MQYDILWFYIPMNDSKGMYLIYSLADLPHNKRNFGLRQRLCLF